MCNGDLQINGNDKKEMQYWCIQRVTTPVNTPHEHTLLYRFDWTKTGIT